MKIVDNKVGTLFISYMLPFIKLLPENMLSPNYSTTIVIVATACFYIFLAFIWTETYHYNIIIRYGLRYRNFEIKTEGEMIYLMLSRQTIENPDQIESCIKLTNYMLIDTTSKDKKETL